MSGSYLQSLGLNQVSPGLNSAPSSDDGLNDLDLFTNSTFDFLDGEFTFEAPATREDEKVGGEGEVVTKLEEPAPMDLFTAEDMFKNIPSLDAPGPFVGGNFNLGIATETTNPQNTITNPPPPPPPSRLTSPVSVSPPVATATKGRKRAASSASNAEVSTAADEDKRRRNTAASARFRVKKKQHEQQLKDKAKELTEYAKKLEERVKKLEMENELLRSLIVEKNGGEETSLEQLDCEVEEN